MDKYLMKSSFTFLFAVLFTFQSVAQEPKKGGLGGLLEKAGQVLTNTSGGSLSNDEIVMGLKEALQVGISNGSAQASALDGYFKNNLIKLAFPPDVQRVETKLRQIGLGNEVDKFILSLNRAAEDAAKKSKPVFVKAITSMSIQDALGILKGDSTAATKYLQRTTNQELYNQFFPVIDSTLKLNNTTKYYTDLVNTYNKLPLVQKVNPDLKQYATQKAIDGLFVLISQEERKIRKDPMARVNDILKKVFGQK
ncbi:DUF4197 domain-containing protein [Runella sp.]|jgi:hypothetical protein|uniref:DUF4197 domain-containing protein n=1 Tax=Runella sp. TaxID=1960881 RepID=UPI0026316453|nr:DUF4197 domain-containing protein [Runella sp.]